MCKCQEIYKRVAEEERGGTGARGNMFIKMLLGNESNYGAGWLRKEEATGRRRRKRNLWSYIEDIGEV